jgi:NDP-sugar pyrophosphorylase family protein
MQAVILAGGLGTRLHPLTRSTPKALVPVCGRPFVDYQIELLKRHGITQILLCIGHLGDQIRAHCGDGSRFGVAIRYGDEGDRRLGTAGALRHVSALLADEFFVTYGDGYLRLDYARVMNYFRRHVRLGLMVIYKNRGRHDRSNVAVDGAFVAAYEKTDFLPGMDWIDFGVSILRREAVDLIPSGRPASLEQLYVGLIAKRQLLAYRARRRFFEIGSPSGLAEFEALVHAGRIGERAAVRAAQLRAVEDGALPVQAS